MKNSKAERADTAIIKYCIAESYKTVSDMSLRASATVAGVPEASLLPRSTNGNNRHDTSEMQRDIIAATLGL